MIRSGAAMPPPYGLGGEPLREADSKPAKLAAPAAPQLPRVAAAGALGPTFFQARSRFEGITLSPEVYGYRNYGTFPSR